MHWFLLKQGYQHSISVKMYRILIMVVLLDVTTVEELAICLENVQINLFVITVNKKDIKLHNVLNQDNKEL